MSKTNSNEKQRYSVFSKGLCEYGLRTRQKLVNPFPPKFLNRLRPFLVGGVPVNVLIALNEMCTGKCYNRARLAVLGLDDGCELVHAKIDSLWDHVNEYADAGHAFAECDDKVYDTTAGLMFDRDFYYEMERPQIERKLTKSEVIAEPSVEAIIAEDTDTGKYALPLILPNLEIMLNLTTEPITQYYKPYIERELAQHKRGINYEQFIQEERENMLLSQTDPKRLDEKLGIVRDEFGAEISRNGVPNPYYRKFDPATAVSLDDFAEEKSIWEKMIDEDIKEIDRQAGIENSIISEKAQKRLSKIALHPTAFAFEIDGCESLQRR
jgi:hypothetical protein